jgi:hypothetical protein
MAKELVSDELWNTIEPLSPDEPPKPKGGRPRLTLRLRHAVILSAAKRVRICGKRGCDGRWM